MESWRTAITDADGQRVIVRGHDLVSLMRTRHVRRHRRAAAWRTHARRRRAAVDRRDPDRHLGSRRRFAERGDREDGGDRQSSGARSGRRRRHSRDRRCARRRRHGLHGDDRGRAGASCAGVAFARRISRVRRRSRRGPKGGACRVLVTACTARIRGRRSCSRLRKQHGKAGPGRRVRARAGVGGGRNRSNRCRSTSTARSRRSCTTSAIRPKPRS